MFLHRKLSRFFSVRTDRENTVLIIYPDYKILKTKEELSRKTLVHPKLRLEEACMIRIKHIGLIFR
jgi:hypothetical protein